jgi:dipeptidase D
MSTFVIIHLQFNINTMNEAIRQLEPKSLWNHFADINAIPRGSKKEDKIIEYMA